MSNATIIERIGVTVGDDAISKFTRFFNGTDLDVIRELLQNAARAGATRVAVVTGEGVIEVSDDGEGISDPSALLAFGRSNWSDPGVSADDPAGMGVFSMARRRVTVTSRPAAGQAWTVDLRPDHFAGETQADVRTVADDAIARGTRVRVSTESVSHAVRAVTAAARYYPLPVTFNGEPVRQESFLEHATHVEEWGGVMIGVYRDRDSAHRTDLNFHGVTLNVQLRSVHCIGEVWTAFVDVRRGAGIELGARHGESPAEASPADWRYRAKHDTCGYRGRAFSIYLSALAAAENHIARCTKTRQILRTPARRRAEKEGYMLHDMEHIKNELADEQTERSRTLLGVIAAAKAAFDAADGPGGPGENGDVIAVPVWAVDALGEALSGEHQRALAFEDLFGVPARVRDGEAIVREREARYRRDWPDMHTGGSAHAPDSCPACHTPSRGGGMVTLRKIGDVATLRAVFETGFDGHGVWPIVVAQIEEERGVQGAVYEAGGEERYQVWLAEHDPVPEASLGRWAAVVYDWWGHAMEFDAGQGAELDRVEALIGEVTTAEDHRAGRHASDGNAECPSCAA